MHHHINQCSITFQPTECNVLTNYTHLRIIDEAPAQLQFNLVFYRVSIRNAKAVAAMDENGQPIMDPANDGRPVREFVPTEWASRDAEIKFYNRNLPWRIMKKLVSDERERDADFVLDYDGAELACGPSNHSIPDVGEDGARYMVIVKSDCEEEDRDADRIKNRRFFVTFNKTHDIPFSKVHAAIRGERLDGSERQQLETAINLLLQSTAVQSGMMRLSSKLLFPLDRQGQLYRDQQERASSRGQGRGGGGRGRGSRGGGRGRGEEQSIPETSNGTKFLLQGVTQRAVFSDRRNGGGALILTDTVAEWCDKEYRAVGDLRRIPLLQSSQRGFAIAGVDVGDLSSGPIDNIGLQKSVEEAIFKLRLNVYYEIPINHEREEALRARGVPEDSIIARRRRIYKNKEMTNDRREGSMGNGHRIMWSANNPDAFAFEVDEQMKTVEQYFQERYNIRLQYPHAPIVCIGRDGWIPIEFIYQHFKKTREANNTDMIKKVLMHYDRISGTSLVEDVTSKCGLLSDGMNTSQKLAMYNLRLSNNPLQLRANVLPDPTIKFGSNEKRANNGSFDLRGVVFAKPATLTSFVVVDLSGNRRLCNEFIQKQLEVSERHGITIPSAVRSIPLNAVTEEYRGHNAIDDVLDVVKNAIDRARNVYISDSTGEFRRPQSTERDYRSFFKTRCISSDNVVRECIVLLPNERSGDDSPGLLIDYNKDDKRNYGFSHRVTTKERTFDARFKVKIRENPVLMDLLDCRHHNGRFQAIKRTNNGGENWVDVTFDHYCFEREDGSIVEMTQVVSYTFLHLAQDYEIDCPSIIFVFLPTDNKALYDKVKYVTNICGGLQSQCAVATKFGGQHNKDQYASNIAIKINTKLSHHFDVAFSWVSRGTSGINAIDWIGDRPTLVIGIGMASGMGSAGETVVSASTLLDRFGMRVANSCFIQQKSNDISDNVMKDIVEASRNASIESWRLYCTENGGVNAPERILIYRDGLSDGNFSQADNEIRTIRMTLNEIKSNLPITYIICQSQHNVRVVPANSHDGVRGNVHSGTVIDHSIMQLGTNMAGFSIDEDARRNISSASGGKMQLFQEGDAFDDFTIDDYFLTAQGGLKGTSKPIYYRVRLNENKVWGPEGGTSLTKENIQKCTYQMSYMYGSATKSTREVPVIKYAKKLSNQVLSQLKYLRDGSTWYGKTYTLCTPGDLDEARRYFVEVTDSERNVICHKTNIVEMPLRNHLAA